MVYLKSNPIHKSQNIGISSFSTIIFHQLKPQTYKEQFYYQYCSKKRREATVKGFMYSKNIYKSICLQVTPFQLYFYNHFLFLVSITVALHPSLSIHPFHRYHQPLIQSLCYQSRALLGHTQICQSQIHKVVICRRINLTSLLDLTS